MLIARSISYTDIGIQFVGEALEYGRVEIFATKFVDGNRSFDESLIAARTPTALFEVSSFFFPFWKFYQSESEVDANMIFAYVGK